MTKRDYFGKRTITVDGQKVELDVKSGLPIVDLSADMAKVASQMAWWASVAASADREADMADSFYRHWRASITVAILDAGDAKNSAEFKIKARIENDPKFLVLKEAISRAKENASIARGVFNSYDKKGNQLQSRGAMVRGEMSKMGMHTPEEEDKNPAWGLDDDPVESAEPVDRVEHMRKLNKDKKKGKPQNG